VLYGGEFYTRTLTYRLQVPADATGTAEFSGQYLYNDPTTGSVTTINISGDTTAPISTSTTTTTSSTTTAPATTTTLTPSLTHANVSVGPAAKTVAKGSSFTIDIVSTPMFDVLGYSFRLAYDLTILNATDIEAGNFLSACASSVPMYIDNEGLVGIDNVCLGRTVTSGTGFATITFEALEGGNTTLALRDVVIIIGLDTDPSNDAIIGTTDGEVTVTTTQTTTSIVATTTTTSTTITTTCVLPGDYPPCGDVTLAEVIDFITQWVEGQVSDNQDVLQLIDAWTMSSSTGSQVTVVRELPATVLGGDSFTVTLTINVNELNMPNAFIITENVPSGWAVSNIGNGIYDAGANKIKWLFWVQGGDTVQDQIITYTIQVPLTASGTVAFTGISEISGNSTHIGGDSTTTAAIGTTTITTTIPECPLRGDQLPCDGIVNDIEYLNCISYWTQGLISDFDQDDCWANYLEGSCNCDVTMGTCDLECLCNIDCDFEWICYDEIDNDFDGSTDCDDPDCYGDYYCPQTTTTLTTTIPTTSTSTTSISTTTTTSIPLYCTDYDHGIKTENSSWVEFTQNGISVETEYDSCVDTKTVREWYCFGYLSQSIEITCSDLCLGGRCISVTTSTTTTTSTSTTTVLITTTPPVTVIRVLPESIGANSQLTVTLMMDVNESAIPETVGLSETPPKGWGVISTEPNGSLTSKPGSIEWLFWEFGDEVKDRNITYVLEVSTTANGTYSFSGTVNYGGDTNPIISGDSEVLAVSCPLKGDYLPCGEVTLAEVIDFITLWGQGGASLDDVVDLISAWATT